MKSIPSRSDLRRSASGFSLVEVSLALGIAGFCLLTLLALIPVGLNTNQASIEETAAAGIASCVVADLEATPKSDPSAALTPTSTRFKIPIPSDASGTPLHVLYLGEDGSVSGAIDTKPNAALNPPPRYRVQVKFIAPSNVGSATPPIVQRVATQALLLITWPALADPDPSSDKPLKYTGAYRTVVSLDRN